MKNIKKLIITKLWWDSVDAINNIVGYIAMEYPEVKEFINDNGLSKLSVREGSKYI